jgi:two-component system chemotaxis response regulator CheY
MVDRNNRVENPWDTDSQWKRSPVQGSVLVVEDVTTVRRGITLCLRDAGYWVSEAEDGVEALELLRKEPVDLVVADIKMSRMDGLKLLEEIRRHPETAGLRVLMCTSVRLRGEVLHAAQLGVQGFLLKPIRPKAVLDKVNEILNSAD